ncbi:MAG: PilZ domain-containing protein [Phycisphaerales bacterium]|nr:PilZ domain-containing protein [Phycisphaerales bacterium]
MTTYQGLTVRHHDRHELSLAAEFTVQQEHRSQIRFSAADTSVVDPYTLRVTVRDVSRGGLGIGSTVVVPCRTIGSIRIFTGSPSNRELLFEGNVRIRRVVMFDDSPTYSLGAQFLDKDGQDDTDLDRLLDAAAAVTQGETQGGSP